MLICGIVCNAMKNMELYMLIVLALARSCETRAEIANQCTNSTISITGGLNGVLVYNQRTPTLPGGVCTCSITAIEGKESVRIFAKGPTKIFGQTNCTEQLLIQAEDPTQAHDTIYDSCSKNNVNGVLTIENETPLAVHDISNKLIQIQFTFVKSSSLHVTTKAFKLIIKVPKEGERKDEIQIKCGEPWTPQVTSGTSTMSDSTTPHSSTGDLGPPVDASNDMESSSGGAAGKDVGGSTWLFMAGVVVGVVVAVIAACIFVRKKLQSRKRSPKTSPTLNIDDATAPTDAVCTEIVDNNMYSSVEASDIITHDPPFRPSALPESDQYASTVLVENATYGECDVNPVGHHRKTTPDEAMYSMVTDANMDSGSPDGPSSDSADYFSGTQLVENNLYSQ